MELLLQTRDFCIVNGFTCGFVPANIHAESNIFAKYSILYLSAVFQQIQGLDWCAWCLSNASSPAYEEKLPSKQPSNQAKKNKPISGDFANTWRLKELAKSLSTCGECSMSIHPSSLAAPRQPGATIELTCSRL